MGDVAITIPVLNSLAKKFNVQLVMVTPKAFAPMFSGTQNLTVFSIDKNGRHKGIFGLIRLFSDLSKENPDAIADLHDVLRTKFLRFLFSAKAVKIATINKGRFEKKLLVKNGKNKSSLLKSSSERYKAVFSSLGFEFDIDFHSIFPETPPILDVFVEAFGEKNGKWIGIAPFAKHRSKMFPEEKMEQLIEKLDKQSDIKILLFGQGTFEESIMKKWVNKYPNVHIMPSEVRLPSELNLMANLDLMLSMDSANMHLASLVNLPVMSIWGATHYYAGFLGHNQLVSNIIESDIDCRPCSIYGNIDCKRKDYACLNELKPDYIYKRVTDFLQIKQ